MMSPLAASSHMHKTDVSEELEMAFKSVSKLLCITSVLLALTIFVFLWMSLPRGSQGYGSLKVQVFQRNHVWERKVIHLGSPNRNDNALIV